MAQCRAMNYARAMHCGAVYCAPPPPQFSLFILTLGTHPLSIVQVHAQ